MNNYNYKIWNHEDKINGNSADVVHSAHGITEENTAYLVYRNDSLLYFQTSNPFGGELTKENADEVAKRHIEEIKENDEQEKIAEIENKSNAEAIKALSQSQEDIESALAYFLSDYYKGRE